MGITKKSISLCCICKEMNFCSYDDPPGILSHTAKKQREAREANERPTKKFIPLGIPPFYDRFVLEAVRTILQFIF